MNADTPLPGDSGAPLNLDARVPCAFCGGELLWRVTTDDDDVVDVVGWCSSCPSEWDGPPAPVTWRTLATSGDEVPAAYVARLVAEVDRLTACVDKLADRVTAAEGRLELARDTPGPHIPPALMRRIEALGFVPGGGEPVGWLLGYVEGTAALLTTAQGERDELAATLANERGEGEPPVDGFHWSHGRRAWVYQPWLMRPKETGPERVVRQGPLGWELYMDGIRTDAEYVSARASMADSPAVVAARSAGGGGS